jgi:hypothetical protein
MKYLFLLIGFYNTSWIFGQSLPEFSVLSSRQLSQPFFISQRIDDGILYYLQTSADQGFIYKIGPNGQLIDSLDLQIEGYSYSGVLTHYNGSNCLVGHRYLLTAGSFDEISASLNRSIVYFDDDLNILNINIIEGAVPNVPPYLLGWTLSLQLNSSALMMPVGGAACENGICWSVWDYNYYDTLNFLAVEKVRYFEKIDLNGTLLAQSNLDDNVGQVFNNAIFAEENMFVFGWLSDVLPFSPKSVGKYDLNGNFKEVYALDYDSSSDTDLAAINLATGEAQGASVFVAYHAISNSISDGCQGPSAVLEQRDGQFNLIKQTKVPACGEYPGGKNCFAFDNEGNVFYQTQTIDGRVGLHKYDAFLAHQWSQLFDFGIFHSPISLTETSDGGCVLECIASENNLYYLKLYKVDAEGNIVSKTTNSVLEERMSLFPNPTTGGVTLRLGQPILQPVNLKIFDHQGRLLQMRDFSNLSETWVDLSAYPSSLYILELKTEEGVLLGASKVVLQRE